MALSEAKLKKVQQAIEGIKTAGSEGPVIISWPDADSCGHVLIIDNKMFGLEYANPYADLNNVSDELLNDEESTSTILSAYRNDPEPASVDEMEEFLEAYSDQVNYCNTDYKEQLRQHAEELSALVNKARANEIDQAATGRPRP